LQILENCILFTKEDRRSLKEKHWLFFVVFQVFSGGETSGLQQVSAAAGLFCYEAVLLE